ncbi:MobF family relaxase [Luteipulveratus halotolerans]|uniref:Transfer protein Tra n=1 Tax=Luteipulveratus halotolerans TaxID=1631356 RepID=A0A0L6CEH0_9MICO|nr:MobF family relaxase [Luteipulveratus halotolerans]KNX35955.1 transfer protein Tra [Luteipulveratus halotolerans]
MSIHKLTAGSGYDYLTRQVAAMDATDKGHTGLASYYTEKGETPGVWAGSGMVGIDGLAAGDVVTAAQMQALFGSGHHPLAHERREQLRGPDLSDKDVQAVTRLGVPYKVYSSDVSAYRLEVAKRLADLNEAAGLPGDWPVAAEERARVRTEVAQEFFRAEHGRDPLDARELAATIAKHSRPKTQAVAGYDLTFSPVKSVSTLWAIADPSTAARIERAHQAAVKDALTFIEEHALYSREGTNGVRQVDVQGLVATAFTHRDSRAADPDLHTHVAVANKVQTAEGKWLAIDGRVLFKATVAASETYNTALERHLHADLGLNFAERTSGDLRKRPIREVVGVDPALNQRWSARRISIEGRRNQLAADFQRTHGRPPTPVESVKLAQQATLETRDPKHEPRTLAEQRSTWRDQAREVLGGEAEIAAMLSSTMGPGRPGRTLQYAEVDIDATARAVVTQMESRRSTWQVWHVRAEAERQVRGAGASPARMPQLVDQVVERALTSVLSTPLTRVEADISEPPDLRRKDGTSVYTVAGAGLFTSPNVLAAERRLVAAAGRTDGHRVDELAVDLALMETTANGVTLNAGQTSLVRGMATSGARVQLAIAPAGAGKTTAMRALAGAWAEGGGTVLGLAPSAAAAAALRAQIDTSTDTLAKLIHEITERDPDLRTWLDVPAAEQALAEAAGAQWDPDARSWYAPDGPAQTARNASLAPWRVTVTDIGPETLVVIDEAGMADTLSLDLAVQFVLDRGGSVRLIGDDQQLAAIGAGGVLRDIQATHGASRLTELVRFVDPAEGSASLALRDGQPEALGFYLDRERVHVGDLSTMTEDVFSAWQADRGNGLDSLMLAPTRELVSELNQRARAHRLEGTASALDATAAPTVGLADGNLASVGDLVITRSNDRRLRTAATDWVKNGDRWTVLGIESGALKVQHANNGRLVTLPADYVQSSTELGYATTVHAAQGVSVDTMHGLASGDETRQQLYTMMTRGKHANHVYLEVVGDGDPHSVIRPEMTHPLTPTDLLERILARDDAPRSASTMLREQAEPTVLLGQAAQRYLDALYVAAEKTLGAEKVQALEADAERVVPEVTEQPAWPALRAHLILTSAQGADPISLLRAAAGARELDTAADTAAVLDWRLDDSGLRGAGRGPLPWVPAVPDTLAADAIWGPYLRQRAAKVSDLAGIVRDAAIAGETPAWASHGGGRPADTVLGDVAVWRAAMLVDDADQRPTGRPQLQKAAALWQGGLTERLTGDRAPAMDEWGSQIAAISPASGRDPFAPFLAERLAAMARSGVDAPGMLRRAAAAGTLPDEHAAAALWWRISRHLSPAVAEQVDNDQQVSTAWATRLPDLLGPARAKLVQDSPWWPTLVTTVDRAVQRGWTVDALFRGESAPPADLGDDPCQSLVWRLSVAMDPVPDEHREFHPEDDDLWEHVPPPEDDVAVLMPHHADEELPLAEAPDDPDHLDPLERADPAGRAADDLEHQLVMAELVRDSLGPLETTEALIDRAIDREVRFADSPVTTERIAQINALTLAYYRGQLPQSWAAEHLVARLGTDLVADERFQPGFAPPGWDRLVKHLRGHGVNDEEMVAAGVAKRNETTGRVRDHFVNRLVLPIIHRRDGWENFDTVPFGGEDVVLGFVGRRHPDLTDEDKKGPKYLNSPTTSLFSMGSQLYVAGSDLYENGTRPVLVEGPMDAIAVTLAGEGALVGVAPLGTSLTEEQARQLAAVRDHFGSGDATDLDAAATEYDPWLVVATDNDKNLSGQVAAERDYWLLAPHDLDPGHAVFPAGLDPADMFTLRGAAALRTALERPAPLADTILEERLNNLPPDKARIAAARVLAARPARHWRQGAARVSGRLRLSTAMAQRDLIPAAESWATDRNRAARTQLDQVRDVRDRMRTSSQRPPQERWAGLAGELDNRLPREADWPALAQVLDQAHAEGHDVPAVTRKLVSERPLAEQPAQDLRYRLVAALDVPIDTGGRVTTSAPVGADRDRRAARPAAADRPTGPRR